MDRVIRDLRNYIFGLRPGILADRQLDQALQRLCEEFQERTGVVAVAEVDLQVAAELASQAGDVVQLAREALSNVSRHAGAATCRVSLYRAEAGLVLEVDDDGQGFDPAAATGSRTGSAQPARAGRAPRWPGRDPQHPRPGNQRPGHHPRLSRRSWTPPIGPERSGPSTLQLGLASGPPC